MELKQMSSCTKDNIIIKESTCLVYDSYAWKGS